MSHRGYLGLFRGYIWGYLGIIWGYIGALRVYSGIDKVQGFGSDWSKVLVKSLDFAAECRE